MSQRPTLGKPWGGIFGNGENAGEVQSSRSATAAEPSGLEPEPSVVTASPTTPERDREHAHSLASPLAAGATLVRKMQSLLVGNKPDDSRRHSPHKRTSGLPALAVSPRPSADEKPGATDEEEEAVEGEDTTEGSAETPRPPSPSKGIVQSASQPVGNMHRRAATILDSQGRSTRHERRSSTGGALLTAGGTIGRHRRPSMGFAGRAERLFARDAGDNELSEKREEEEDAGRPSADAPAGDHEESFNHESAKPVYLKGLFR